MQLNEQRSASEETSPGMQTSVEHSLPLFTRQQQTNNTIHTAYITAVVQRASHFYESIPFVLRTPSQFPMRRVVFSPYCSSQLPLYYCFAPTYSIHNRAFKRTHNTGRSLVVTVHLLSCLAVFCWL